MASSADTSLPAVSRDASRCGEPRASRRGKFRAAALILVHVLVIAHVAHWKVGGETLTPMEPSEAMQTLELGYVNAGFLLLCLTILLTLVFGRFFCGWACHVVAYQDLCSWILGRLGIRPRPVRSRLLMLIPFLAAFYMFAWPTVLRWLSGGETPTWAWHLKTDSFWQTFPGPVVAMLTILVDGFLIVYLLGSKGFCTYGCPYGGIFATVAQASPGRILVNDNCEGCGHCTQTCTSNVRVHEEVALHGMVVDPGCMKCMDCVNVCPKEALRFGWGNPLPALRKGRGRERLSGLFRLSVLVPTWWRRSRAGAPRARRVYDFRWSEEIVLALTFLGGLYAFRSLYGLVPFLLSLGLAVILAVSVVAAVRLWRRPDFHFQHLTLKRGGRYTTAGIAAILLAATGWLGAAHSAFVQYHTREGERLLHESWDLSTMSEKRRVLERSRSLLGVAARWGAVEDPGVQNVLAVVCRDLGDLSAAEHHLRRAIAREPTATKSLELSTLCLQQGKLQEAHDVLRELLEEGDNPEARRRLEILEQRMSGSGGR